MRTIDGSRGEGGGQVVRTALALAAVRGEPVEVVNIRAGRSKPGLRPQHLAVVRALADVTKADVEGAEVGSTHVTFRPGAVSRGSFVVDVGTAGSVTLVLHALLPLAHAATGPLRFTLRGGTDVPFAPTLDHTRHALIPALARMGLHAKVEVYRRGFAPAGGGEVRVEVESAPEPRPLVLDGAAAVRNVACFVASGGLPSHVPERIHKTANRALRDAGFAPVWKHEETDTDSPGVALCIAHESQARVLGVDALGEKGLASEDLARRCIEGFLAAARTPAATDAHLADQLLLFAALADGESSWTAPTLTRHAETQAALVAEMMGRTVEAEGRVGLARIRVV